MKLNLLLVLLLLQSACVSWPFWRMPDKHTVDLCVDSNGCWNYRDNTCERVDETRCPNPTPQ